MVEVLDGDLAYINDTRRLKRLTDTACLAHHPLMMDLALCNDGILKPLHVSGMFALHTTDKPSFVIFLCHTFICLRLNHDVRYVKS